MVTSSSVGPVAETTKCQLWHRSTWYLAASSCVNRTCAVLQAIFAGFADTATLGASSASLPTYFDSATVQQQLQEEQERSASLAGSITNMMDKVMAVQPLVHQFAESAKTAGTKISQKLMDAKPSVADRLAADIDGSNLRAASPDEFDQEHESQSYPRQKSNSGMLAAGRQTANQATAVLEQVQAELHGRFGSKWPAVVATVALAVAAAGTLLTRRAPAALPAGQTVTILRNQDSSAAAAKAIDKSAALRLIKAFQKAKGAALGSSFDTSQLSSVCVGQALAQFTDMSQDWASQGWFRSSNVWKVEIQKIEPRSSSGQRLSVLARLGETSNTWGVDGQQGNSWSNEYDVEYDVVLCSDLQWRIQGVQVRGKEPGMPGWFGFGKGK